MIEGGVPVDNLGATDVLPVKLWLVASRVLVASDEYTRPLDHTFLPVFQSGLGGREQAIVKRGQQGYGGDSEAFPPAPPLSLKDYLYLKTSWFYECALA